MVQLSHPPFLPVSFVLVPLLPLILNPPADAPSLAGLLHVLLLLVSTSHKHTHNRVKYYNNTFYCSFSSNLTAPFKTGYPARLWNSLPLSCTQLHWLRTVNCLSSFEIRGILTALVCCKPRCRHFLVLCERGQKLKKCIYHSGCSHITGGVDDYHPSLCDIKKYKRNSTLENLMAFKHIPFWGESSCWTLQKLTKQTTNCQSRFHTLSQKTKNIILY